jgi:hypothetical protein
MCVCVCGGVGVMVWVAPPASNSIGQWSSCSAGRRPGQPLRGHACMDDSGGHPQAPAPHEPAPSCSGGPWRRPLTQPAHRGPARLGLPCLGRHRHPRPLLLRGLMRHCADPLVGPCRLLHGRSGSSEASAASSATAGIHWHHTGNEEERSARRRGARSGRKPDRTTETCPFQHACLFQALESGVNPA